jgi:protoporphyrinogen oxidase
VALSQQIARERNATPAGQVEPATLRAWLERAFGPTLCEVFFFPFHERYTAGQYKFVAPEDSYKSPAVPVASRVPAGKREGAGRVGYNAEFCYPEGGLDALVGAMAARCDVRYGRQLVGIDRGSRTMQFADGTERDYETLISTLPLDRVVELAGVEVNETPDPFTSVLVLNIGAERGPTCPDLHWLYEPDSRSGFHRIGFYSGVDQSFLPRWHRAEGRYVSLYVERAFRSGGALSAAEQALYAVGVVEELQGRGYIGAVEVVDPSWVEVAYTWRKPGSRWREQALTALAADGIHQAGRYGTWQFQGIADSVSDGLDIGVRSPGPQAIHRSSV